MLWQNGNVKYLGWGEVGGGLKSELHSWHFKRGLTTGNACCRSG